MSSRWWFPFDGMEEMSFKRVPEGWVYRVPNPWLLGRSRYYLVSEKQKSEIAGHHRGGLDRAAVDPHDRRLARIPGLAPVEAHAVGENALRHQRSVSDSRR